MRILFFLLFPIFLSAQINRAYGVVEIGSFPTSSSTGPKFAYRPVDSSFYRWVSGNTWVKIIEPSIIPDTLYITEEIGTSYKISGDTLHLTPYLLKSDTSAMLVKYIERGDTLGMLSAYIRSAGWGLLKSSYTLRADSTLLATRSFAKNLPTYIANTQIAYSNGSNLVGSTNLTYSTNFSLRGNLNNHLYYSAANANSGNVTTSGYLAQANDGSTSVFRHTSSGYNATSIINSSSGYIYSDNHFTIVPVKDLRIATGASLVERMRIWGTTGNVLIQESGAYSDISTSIFSTRSTTKASSPFPLQTLAQADAITGVQGNFQYETTQNGLRWYNGIRKAYALESTFARGTNTYVPVFNSFGQITENPNMTFTGSLFSIVGSVTATSDIHSTSSSFNGLRSLYIRHNNDGTDTRGALYAQVGSNANTDNTISIQSFSNSYTNSVFGGSYIAGNYLVTGLSFQPTVNSKRMHFAVGATNTTTPSDTVEYVYHRFNLSNSLSNATRFAAISNRGVQIPSTTTAGRVLSKANQYWLSYNTDSLQFNYRDNLGWHMLATRSYARSLIPTTLYMGNGTLTSNRTITSGGFDLRYTGNFSIGSSSAPVRTLDVTGAARITGSAGTATSIMGRDANGDISNLSISSDLKLASGTLGLKRKSLIDSLPIGPVAIDGNDNPLAFNFLNSFTVDFETTSGSINSDGDITTIESDSEIHLTTVQDAILDLTDEVKLSAPNLDGSNSFTVGYEGFYHNFVNTSAVTDSAFSIITDGDRKLIRAHGYGNGYVDATSTGEYPGKYILATTANHNVMDYRIDRDTLVVDANLSVGTLLYYTQNLHINLRMTALASTNSTITFPDASDSFRGKSIYVRVLEKDPGIYVPVVNVAGGVSRLLYTSNTTIAPTDQANLTMDNATWPFFRTYKFTCLNTGTTPNYRWVLNQ